MAEPAAVLVYVHGLWMQGFEGALLLRRLRAARAWRCQAFGYRSWGPTLDRVADQLAQYLARIQAPRVHLLGHSLGGLVILRCLERHRPDVPGRVVLLGSPVRGSRAARRLASIAIGRALLGRAGREALLAMRAGEWGGGRELGIIAGTMPVGLGHLLLTFGEDNDGVVAVSETELAGAACRLNLPVNHMGMLLSARVAREAGSFLEHGRFGA